MKTPEDSSAGPPAIRIYREAGPRTIFSVGMDLVVAALTLVALIPLFSLLYMVVTKGGAEFRPDMLWTLPPAAGMDGGGFGNAIVGTLVMVGIATLVSVPVGILTAIFLTEYASGTKSAQVVRFAAKILSGLPSILAGVFVYAAIVITFKSFSAIAGGIALGILMVPIVILSTEEALLRVPRTLREASIGLGATKSQTTLKVVLPAATSTIITGVMLAVARAAGETAPLIFTALSSEFWLQGLTEPSASLSVLIYNFASQPYPNMIKIAWCASFVLILFVLITNIFAQFVFRKK